MRPHPDSRISLPVMVCLLTTMAIGCARLSVSPQDTLKPDPARDYRLIQTERFAPAWIEVEDFDFSSAKVHENSAPLHRATEYLRGNSAEDRQAAIARGAAASLSLRTVRQLDEMGFMVTRISSDDDVWMPGDNLVITGRLLDVNEGNRLMRVGVGLGAGQSTLDTEVHVFRVSHGEWAEILAFNTHADSGRMPGLAESMPLAVFLIGPITAFSVIENAATSGQKIYSTQIDYLAGQTGDQIAMYLSQYFAEQSWIPGEKAGSVNLVTEADHHPQACEGLPVPPFESVESFAAVDS